MKVRQINFSVYIVSAGLNMETKKDLESKMSVQGTENEQRIQRGQMGSRVPLFQRH